MRLTSLAKLWLGTALLLIGSCILAAPPTTGYHLLQKIPLGATSGPTEYFDLITFDNATRRVYLSHGTEVKVVDAENGSVLGTITGLKRCHGVAVLHYLGRGFITDSEARKVVVFDTHTLKVIGDISAEDDADTILYDPGSKHIFSFNGNSKNATIIDPVKLTVIGTLALPGKPELAAADGEGTIYNNIVTNNLVAVIDSKALKVKAQWPVAPAGQPTSIALDQQHNRLFSAGRKPQMLVMMDTTTGKIIQSLPISGGTDTAIFDPKSENVFVSTRDGIIHIFHEDSPNKLSEVETITTEYGAKTMAMDPKTGRLFVDTADFTPPAADGARRAIPGTFRLLIYGR